MMPSDPANETKPLIFLGGTFDPVHFGHLRLAETLHNLLPEADIHWIPCYRPSHRNTPHVTMEHRLAMIELAIGANDYFMLDDRESRRDEPSYTYTTLKELKRDFPKRPVVLAMGSDSAMTLPQWYQAKALSDLCHVVIMMRPGADRSSLPEDVTNWWSSVDNVQDMLSKHQGHLYWLKAPLLDISSSYIRQLMMSGQSPQFLLPEKVFHYIIQHDLYTADD